MAQLKRFKERLAEVDQLIQLVTTVKNRLQAAWDYEKQEFANGILVPNDFATRVQGILTGLTDLTNLDLKAAIDLLKANIEIWPAQVSKDIFSNPKAWSSVAIDVVSGSDATLTINQDDTVVIFTTVFAPADVIEISNSEDPNHDGFHTIKAAGVADQVLTLAANMLGEDEANDETMIITLVER